MKIHHFLLSLFFILPFSSYSQFPSITLADPSFQYQIIQKGQEGLLLYSETKTDDKKNIKMMFELYDSNFVRKASKSTMRSEAMNTALEFYSTANKAYYSLSNDFFKIDTWKNNFKIISFDLETKTFSTLEGKLPKGFWMTSLYVVKNSAYVKSLDGKWVKINLTDGETNPMELGVNKPLLDRAFISNEVFHTSAIVFSDKPEGGSWGFKTKNFGEGKEFKNTSVYSGNEYNLATLALTQTDINSKFGAGTYTKKLSQEDDKQFPEKESNQDPYFISDEGFYFTGIVNNEQAFIKFIPYPRINSKINNKIKRKEGDEISLYKSKVHPPVKIDQAYLVVADIYQRGYLSRKEYSYQTNGFDPTKPRTNTNIVVKPAIDEFKYSLLLMFDEKGNILWRDSIDVSETLLIPDMDGKMVVSKSSGDDNYYLYYVKEAALKCSQVNSMGIKNIVINQEKSPDKNGVSLNPYFLNYWHDRTFYYLSEKAITLVKY